MSRVQSLLNARWDQAATMTVLDAKGDCGDYGHPEDDKVDDIVVGADVPMQQLQLHVVKPEIRWCPFGSWQDCMIACQHAMAVYRLLNGKQTLDMYRVGAGG